MTTTAPLPPGYVDRPLATARLFADAAADLAAHQARYGAIPWQGERGRLVGEIEAAGLTGRGGAGFPTWRKLVATATAGGAPVVVANGAEGEPASAKDATLLRRAPHLVLDGLQLAAEAIGATTAYLYAPAGTGLETVLAQRKAQRRDRVPVRLVTAPDTFVAGQESAVIARIEGRPAVPADRLRLTAESGVRGRPTLVQNVETLAHLAQIARNGARWFRERGTAAEPGTFLATISGPVARPGVYELPIGLPLGAALDNAGGATESVRAVLVGGFHSGWLALPGHGGTPLSAAGLRPVGGTLGAGVLMALPAALCPLAQSARIVEYLAAQSARQCGPCRFGLPTLADALTAVAHAGTTPGARGTDIPAAVRRLHAYAGLVEGRGACHHPDGTARFVRSTLTVFDGEIQAHRDGYCTAHGGIQ